MIHIGTPASGVYAQATQDPWVTCSLTFKGYAICRGASGIEIRRYAPFLIAEVTIEGDNMKEALAMGFKQASCNRLVVNVTDKLPFGLLYVLQLVAAYLNSVLSQWLRARAVRAQGLSSPRSSHVDLLCNAHDIYVGDEVIKW